MMKQESKLDKSKSHVWYFFFLTVLLMCPSPLVKFTNLKFAIQWFLMYYSQLCNCHHNQFQNNLITQKETLQLSLCPQPQAISFLSLQMGLLWRMFLSGILQYVVLCDWFIGLSIIFLGFIHVISCDSTCSFLFLNNTYLLIRHLTCFHPLAMKSNVP